MGQKPFPGHRCRGVSLGASANCECGWSSVTFFGKGARSQAYSEWHSHVERHREAEAEEQRLREAGVTIQRDMGEVNVLVRGSWVGRFLTTRDPLADVVKAAKYAPQTPKE